MILDENSDSTNKDFDEMAPEVDVPEELEPGPEEPELGSEEVETTGEYSLEAASIMDPYEIAEEYA